MNISRYNYEEIFMLYADNELSAEDRKAVELFVEQNTDLAEELNLLKQLQFKPDARLVFMDKESLFRNEEEHETININNYEAFFVLYADNELNNAEQASVEKFVYQNPALQSEFELIQSTKLEADKSVVYEHKEELYRHEKDEKVVPFIINIRYWKWVAAAVLIVLAGFIWMNQTGTNKLPDTTVAKENKKETKALPKTSVPEINKEEQVAVAETKKDEKISVQKLKSNSEVVLASADKRKEAKMNEEGQETRDIEANAAIEARKDIVAMEHMSPDKNTTIASLESNINTSKNVENKIQYKEPLIDKPVYIEMEKNEISYASLSDDKNDDVVYVSNTVVRKQNPLRGIFRKASRFVERTTNTKPSDGSGILIGNLSIALR